MNQRKCIYMGADGCYREYGCGRAGKQGKHGHMLVHRAWFWAIWPGKFPRTLCFAWIDNVKDECRWTEIGVDGCGGTCGMGGTRKIQKKIEKFKKISIFGNHDHCAKIRLTLGSPKNRTERAISIIFGKLGLKQASI